MLFALFCLKLLWKTKHYSLVVVRTNKSLAIRHVFSGVFKATTQAIVGQVSTLDWQASIVRLMRGEVLVHPLVAIAELLAAHHLHLSLLHHVD